MLHLLFVTFFFTASFALSGSLSRSDQSGRVVDVVVL